MNRAPKKKCPAGAGQIANKNHASTAIFTPPTAEGNQEANLIACLTTAGYVVHRLSNGGFVACRKGRTPYCHNLDELDAFARRVGAL